MKTLTAALLLCLTLAGAARANDPEQMANDIARSVMSPYCPGVTLHDCPSQEAIELRAQITAWALAGWDRDRILEELEAEFGPGIRAAPEPEGVGVLAWLLPVAFALSAAAATVWLSRRFAARRQSSAAVAPLSGEERKRLDNELGVFRGGET